MPSNRRKLTDQDKNIIGKKCACCQSTENLKYHHIVPIALGGSNLLSNFVCLCDDCHNTIHSGIPGINYNLLGRVKKKESVIPFDINLFSNLVVKYYNRYDGITKKYIAEQLNISRPTLDKYLKIINYPLLKESLDKLEEAAYNAE